ncbi:Repeat domain-containing protein [Dyadobacter koreensis]|uniref:Repeat domain-containing protein n=1 Tax=Dyadobacter koreensis TaxID=408657 RepID=A0A1H6WKA6_9BACT|nr:VCBS repeat-containing protein [Dyadobacter koreensis]SEJ16166.1 Repeat domain-containing protein [Dyadobacter koreensis]
MPVYKYVIVTLLSLWITAFAFIDTKNNDVLTPLNSVSLSDSLPTGEQLAGQYCATCHLFPSPSLLDKKTWTTSVLPNMGYRMGINPSGKNVYEDMLAEEEKLVRDLNVYPRTASISRKDWKKIVEYYEKEAPEKPIPQKPGPIVTNQLSFFQAKAVFVGKKMFPQTTLLKFDKKSSQLYVGDAQNTLYILDEKFQQKDSIWISTPASDIDFPDNASPRLLSVGSLKPSQQKFGSLESLVKEGKKDQFNINIHLLHRPVNFVATDLNMDGKEDVIISEFGNHTGRLLWLDNFESKKQHVLKELPGARKVEIADFNNDKKPDIIALMTQAREEISIFYNLGNDEFREKVVLQFPPVFGSIYFELADFNKDGFQDIILTNGDNWDYSGIKKNYHGIRIYLNDGKDNFKRAWFYPLYGASKAMARDFDGDGDIDIAATSFYTDLDNPEQGFIYLSNEGNLNFKPYSTPEGVSGKWMIMESADYDKDGDEDIILGSYFHNISELTVLMFQGITVYPQLLVLENKTK